MSLRAPLTKAHDTWHSRGKYGEDIFTLSRTYIRGQPPKSVNFYWRRFRVADIPLDSQDSFDAWLRARWYEKDALMEQYLSTGRFPPSPAATVATPEPLEEAPTQWSAFKGLSGAGMLA